MDEKSTIPSVTAMKQTGITLNAAHPMTREKLAGLPAGTIVYREEPAAALECCEKSVTRMVKTNQLPPPMVLGKRRAWLAGQIQKHLLSAAEKIEEDAARWDAKLRQHLSS